MTWVDNQGNTKLSANRSTNRVTIHYDNKEFDLFWYVIPEGNYSIPVGWETINKVYFGHPDDNNPKNIYYAEVINNTGIFILANKDYKNNTDKIIHYDVYEFSLTDNQGALLKRFVQKPNGEFQSYNLTSDKYPQHLDQVLQPVNSKTRWNAIDLDLNLYPFSWDGGSYIDFLREYSPVINPASGDRKFLSTNSFDYQFFDLGNNEYGIRPDAGGTIDPLTGLSSIQFVDKFMTIEADIKGVFDQVTGLNTDSGKMFRLYNAAFARFPDGDGLRYWIGKYSSGENDSRTVASSFLVSDEFKERYGDNVSNANYVETLYVNVLGRDYDQSGYNYWLGNLNSGLETRYELLLGFAESTENKSLFTEMTGFG